MTQVSRLPLSRIPPTYSKLFSFTINAPLKIFCTNLTEFVQLQCNIENNVINLQFISEQSCYCITVYKDAIMPDISVKWLFTRLMIRVVTHVHFLFCFDEVQSSIRIAQSRCCSRKCVQITVTCFCKQQNETMQGYFFQ